ncbi:MAG TPA: MBL fold metallo-hydrolase [Pantanalinema sp.]
MATIRFLGAAGDVTGSKYLIQTDKATVLVDCGLFQGGRALRDRNYQAPDFKPSEIDAVVLTHAHLDHSGYLPRLVVDGYGRKVFATPGTCDLLSILLPDSGFLQEEDAAYANRKAWSRHRPAKALYTMLDAQRALRHLRPVPYLTPREVAPGVTVTFHPAGHIIGSAIVVMELAERTGKTVVAFSGDLGRSGAPILKDPARIPRADYVLVESTYGDRLHPETPPEAELARVVRESVRKGGMLVIPAFAVGRTQELLYVLRELEDRGEIPELPVHVDSPMAVDATQITLAHAEEFDREARERLRGNGEALMPRRIRFARSSDQSRALNALEGPGIILSASGMCTGGRIKHHLARRLPEERNTVCFVGFQAAQTKGRQLVDGAQVVRIHGQEVPVRARIERVDGFSAHADQRQLLAWLGGFERAPRRAFVVHGEPEASQALCERIREDLGWKIHVPAWGEAVVLQAGENPAAERPAAKA